ncbi:MAG: S-adenosyl-l-methionine hydroxide adenosyltransferase family protein [Candidatus Competibacterales bacterium]
MAVPLVALFTDFGLQGSYVGQLHYAIVKDYPQVRVVDLFHDLPAFDIQGAAYLLAAHLPYLKPDTVVMAVVDPGVGGERPGVIVQADGRLLVGPGNGLFDRVVARAQRTQTWKLRWQPLGGLSPSFHGRDWFAPVAAQLAAGVATPNHLGKPWTPPTLAWPDELARVVYIDHYGNAMTGIRARALAGNAQLVVDNGVLQRRRTFCEAAVGEAFWYANANGLVEIAVNQGSAARQLDLQVGAMVAVK